VADGVEYVAHEAVAADALDRVLGKQRPEGRIVQPRELDQRRRLQGLAGVQRLLARAAGELVPRAGRQAVVAAVDAVAEQGPELAGDRPLQLDGQVGDAASRIQLERRGERARRAGVEAGAARTA